ncbi:MAG TPA: DUF2784 family protein [Terracidiphilus sp.]|nr:DUF2784 family protein [Terracidiphilus sp.]
MAISLAILVVTVHLAWLLVVIFGALGTRGRPVWGTLHAVALLWGIVVEVGPWPCPLTLAEEYFEARAGAAAVNGSALLRCLDDILYCPAVPTWLVVTVAVAICILNLAIYARRLGRALKQRRPHA